MRKLIRSRFVLTAVAMVGLTIAVPLVAGAIGGPANQVQADPTPSVNASSSAFILRGPYPGGRTDLRLPDLRSAVTVAEGEVATKVPRAALVAVGDQGGVEQRYAGAQMSADGRFLAEAAYVFNGERGITVSSWTPTGQVELVVPLRSRVTDIMQLMIDGHEAVTIFPAAGVQGVPPMQVYVFNEGVVYYFEAEGFTESSDVLKVVTNSVRGAAR